MLLPFTNNAAEKKVYKVVTVSKYACNISDHFHIMSYVWKWSSNLHAAKTHCGRDRCCACACCRGSCPPLTIPTTSPQDPGRSTYTVRTNLLKLSLIFMTKHHHQTLVYIKYNVVHSELICWLAKALVDFNFEVSSIDCHNFINFSPAL